MKQKLVHVQRKRTARIRNPSCRSSVKVGHFQQDLFRFGDRQAQRGVRGGGGERTSSIAESYRSSM